MHKIILAVLALVLGLSVSIYDIRQGVSAQNMQSKSGFNSSDGEKWPNNFAISLPMRGKMRLYTSSQNHECYAGGHKDSAQDCFALDFFAETNPDIYPIAAGEVAFVGTLGGGWDQYGTVVYIRHGQKDSNGQINYNGYTSLYAHLSSTNVARSSWVQPTTKIGVQGCSGGINQYGTCGFYGTGKYGNGYHLHLAIYKGASFTGGPYGGKSIAVGHDNGDPTFINCVINSGERCDNLYRHRSDTKYLNLTHVTSPQPPELINPVEGQKVTNGIWPRLEWQLGIFASAPHGYRVQVSKNDSQFRSPIVDQCVTSTNYLPRDDWWMQSHTGKLYWRIAYVRSAWNWSQNTCKSVGINGIGWSSVRWFENQYVPPTITRTPTAVSVVPSLQSPANGQTTTDGLWPTLSWNSTSKGPFEIRVSRNPNFSDCVVCEPVSGKSYRPSGGSADAWMRARTGTFYWRVRVAGGTWSSGRLFINTSPPTWTPTRTPTTVSVVPSLQSPANGHTTTDGLWPALSWNSTSTGPFEIRVSKNSNFSDCIVCENVSGKSYRPSGSGADAWMRSHIGTLYWRVRVVGGTWSLGRSFQNTIDITHTPSPTRSRTPAPHTPTWTPTRPPPTWTRSPTASPRPTDAELTMPVLSSPADGATDVSTKVELDWQDVTRGNVNRYEVEVCIETSRGSNNWNCDKYDTNGAESRWKVWDRTGKIFPQRKIRWRVNANDGTKDGPVSEWRYFQPRYNRAETLSPSGDTLKIGVSRESNDITYRCKYNFSGFGSGGSWSSVDSTSFSGSSCSFSISSMRSKGAYAGRTIAIIITSDSKKTLGDFDGRENTDGFYQTFKMP